MSRIEWSSLIADDRGRIDYGRMGRLLSLLLALSGGATVTLAMAGLIHVSDFLAVGAGMLVAPLTVGKAVDGFRGAANQRESRAILAGEVPGRRAVDRSTGEGGA
jgi:hypothetical protein